MKWFEAKDKAKDKVWAFLELRPTGKVLTKEQYDYVMYYAKHTGIDCSYVRSFEEEKGKYLRLGSWFGGASYYFFFGDQPEGIIETAVTNEWKVIETFKEYYEDFSYGKLGKIEFDE